MKQTLDDFILEWNKTHKKLFFSLQKAPAIDRPTEIGIRYSVAEYEDFLSSEQWGRLTFIVERKSHGAMYVSSDEMLFNSGIIDIAVSSANHNYQECYVISVLKWICEKFFSYGDEDD